MRQLLNAWLDVWFLIPGPIHIIILFLGTIGGFYLGVWLRRQYDRDGIVVMAKGALAAIRRLLANKRAQFAASIGVAGYLLFLVAVQPDPGATISGDSPAPVRDLWVLTDGFVELPENAGYVAYTTTSLEHKLAIEAEEISSAKETIETCFDFHYDDCYRSVVEVESEFGSLEAVGFSRFEANNIRELTSRRFQKALAKGLVMPLQSFEEDLDELPNQKLVAALVQQSEQYVPPLRFICRKPTARMIACLGD